MMISDIIMQIFLYSFMLATIISALGVILNTQPIKALLCLILCFIFTACIWIMFQAAFLGFILIIVYIGAVMVLFLFTVMMLKTDVEQCKIDKITRILHISIIFAFLAIVFSILAFVLSKLFSKIHINNIMITKTNNLQYLGQLLFSNYVLAFELAGILLLFGMIAVIAITKTNKQKNQNKKQNINKQLQVSAKSRLKIIKDGDKKC